MIIPSQICPSTPRALPILSKQKAGVLRFLLTLLVILVPVHAQVHQASAHVATVVTDLPADPHEAVAITSMARQGIMSPTVNGHFNPAAFITAGDFAVSIKRLFNLPSPASSKTYDDVPPSSIYHEAVASVSTSMGTKILCGPCSLSSNFYPNEPITSGVAAVTLVRLLKSDNKISLLPQVEADNFLLNYSDARTLLPLARVYIAAALKAGILTTAPNQPLGIGAPPTRAMMATWLSDVQVRFNLPSRGNAGPSLR